VFALSNCSGNPDSAASPEALDSLGALATGALDLHLQPQVVPQVHAGQHQNVVAKVVQHPGCLHCVPHTLTTHSCDLG